MSMFSNWLHPERGYEKAEDQLNNYWDQGQQYFNQGQSILNPYVQQGQQAYTQYANAGNALLNPEDLEARFINSYAESPYAKQLQSQAQQNGLNAASSMGILGSSPALNAIQQGSTNIMNADRQQYLNDLIQKYMQGVGIMGNIYGGGENAAGAQAQGAFGMSKNALQQGENMANLAYNAQNAQGSLFGNILGQGVNLAADFLTGGGSGMSPGGGWKTQAAPMAAAALL